MRTETDPRAAPRVGAARFERLLAPIVGVFDLLYALQTLDSFAADRASTPGPLGTAAALALAAGIVLGLVAAVVPTAARRLFAAAAAAYAVGALLWPLALRGPVPTEPMPWFVAMWITALGALAVACRRPLVPGVCSALAGGYLAGVLLLVGRVDVADAVVNGIFAIALSAVLLALVTAIRRGVDRADSAQRAALARYARSSSDEATEAERVRTDALVHDSVLTTFLSAAAADDAEAEDLARRMAENALRVLSHVTRSAEHGPVVALARALAEAEPALGPLRSAFDVEVSGLDHLVLPERVAAAMLDSMLHAMADGVERDRVRARGAVRMTALGPDGLRVDVEDDGIRPDGPRRDLHASIVRRMRRVDGRADIDTTQHGHRRVRLSWGSVVVSGTAPLPADEAVTA